MGRPRKLAGLAELCRRRGRSAPAAAGEQQQQRQGCGIVIRPASRPSRRHVRVVKVQCTVASQAQARGGLHSKKESLFAPHSGSRWTPPGRWMQTPQSTGSCWRRPAVDGRGGSQRGGRHSPHSVMPSSGSWRLARALGAGSRLPLLSAAPTFSLTATTVPQGAQNSRTSSIVRSKGRLRKWMTCEARQAGSTFGVEQAAAVAAAPQGRPRASVARSITAAWLDHRFQGTGSTATQRSERGRRRSPWWAA